MSGHGYGDPEHMAVIFSASGGAHDTVSLGRWAREIVPAVREAIAKENG
jgi:hypothetical protein